MGQTYGIDTAIWVRLPPDDQAAVKAGYLGQPIPKIGGYADPVTVPAATPAPPPTLSSLGAQSFASTAAGSKPVANIVKPIEKATIRPAPETTAHTLAAREASLGRVHATIGKSASAAQPATAYYTYRDDVPLRPGQTIGFATGRGYYTAGTPIPIKATNIPPTPATPQAEPVPTTSTDSSADTDALVLPGVRGIFTRPGITLIPVPTSVGYDAPPSVAYSGMSVAPPLVVRPGPSPPPAALEKLPKWMLDGKAPPPALTHSGTLPRALTPAANPLWRTPAGREKFAFDYLRHALHLSGFQAAALVGNIAVESRQGGVDLKPGIWQSYTPASTHTVTSGAAGFGIAMWTYPARKEALSSFSGQLPWTNFAVELAFVAHELKYPHEVVHGHAVDLIQRNTLNKLQQSGSIEEATALVMAVYEHPTTYRQVPTTFPSVAKLMKDWNQGSPEGPDPKDQSGYFARLTAAKKINQAHG